ncbi:uncharacterized protein [Antennarius striatus]|uniref:uncharacterized protein n=1 Tax=Antennarius striatus TaxID=241820 RepID=UPI0035AE1148
MASTAQHRVTSQAHTRGLSGGKIQATHPFPPWPPPQARAGSHTSGKSVGRSSPTVKHPIKGGCMWTHSSSSRTLGGFLLLNEKNLSRRLQTRSNMLKLKSRVFFCIAVLSLTLLVLIYRSDESLHVWIHHHQPGLRRLQCPGEIVPDGEKVVVKKMKTVLLSAYREHRTGKREVRVIAVVQRKESVKYHCHLCCQGQLQVTDGVSYIHFDHFGFRYGTTDIMCPIPTDCVTPSFIAVTSAADDSEDTFERRFLEVKNQKARRSFSYNFTVCFSTMFDFTNVLQLVQSMEMLKLLGVDRVAIYKTSNSPETQRILDYYTKKGVLEVIPWALSTFMTVSRSWLPRLSPGDLHYFGQLPALNDCLYRYMYQSSYVAMHDVDELILPQFLDSWLEMLPLLEKLYGPDQCYMFENNVFPNTISLAPPESGVRLPQTLWDSVPGVNILAHLYQEPRKGFAHLSNFKVIVNPRTVFTTSVHGVLDSLHGCSWVHRTVGRMYHTRAPLAPQLPLEELIFDDRLLYFSKRLVAAVDAVLTDTGFLSKESVQ